MERTRVFLTTWDTAPLNFNLSFPFSCFLSSKLGLKLCFPKNTFSLALLCFHAISLCLCLCLSPCLCLCLSLWLLNFWKEQPVLCSSRLLARIIWLPLHLWDTTEALKQTSWVHSRMLTGLITTLLFAWRKKNIYAILSSMDLRYCSSWSNSIWRDRTKALIFKFEFMVKKNSYFSWNSIEFVYREGDWHIYFLSLDFYSHWKWRKEKEQ